MAKQDNTNHTFSQDKPGKTDAGDKQVERAQAKASHEAPPSLQGNHGTHSNEAPDLVQPSRLNEGDTGAASDKPEAGGQLEFEDGDMIDGGRGGNKARTGGTWSAVGADSAPLGAPAEILSNSNKPSDQSDRPEGTLSDGNST